MKKHIPPSPIILGLIVFTLLAVTIAGSIGNRSYAQLAPAIPSPLPLPPGAAGPFSFTNWTGFIITTTNFENVQVQMDYTTAEGVHITNGVKKTFIFTSYEIGLKVDGSVCWRKVGP